MFNGIRYSFLLAVCGSGCVELQDFLGASNDSIPQQSVSTLFHFVDTCKDALNPRISLGGPPPSFASGAWPLLWDCLTSEAEAYYLSYSELLLICEVMRFNVAVFGIRRGRASFLGSTLPRPHAEVRLVAMRMYDGPHRVRSHFERLIPSSVYT